MVGKDSRYADGVVGGLAYEGYRVRHILSGSRARRLTADRFEVDFLSEDSVRELAGLLKIRPEDRVGVIVNFLGLEGARTDSAAPLHADGDALSRSLGTLHIAKVFFEDLEAAAAEGEGGFFNITGLDGRLGLRVQGPTTVEGSGTLGIAKALRQECPSLRVRNVDLDPAGDPQVMVGRLFEEFQWDDGELEVGLDEGGRWTFHLKEGEISHSGPFPEPLDSDSVILVTGGARGITAEVIKALAKETPCRYVLVGRSELPGIEDPATKGLDPSEIRGRFISQMREGGKLLPPAEIERQVRGVLKSREIRENMGDLEASGARVEYHSLDVGDGAAFGLLLDDLYLRYGRIDGVFHGAGVIEDSLIVQKTDDSFERVFRTKVNSAQTLVRRLQPDSLRFLVFFSSVSARFGNPGQSDYGAANEYLNKLAATLNHSWPARVVSINWGPWAAGMVSDDNRRRYAERGIPLISVEGGVDACLAELALGQDGPSEVTIAAGLSRLLQQIS